MTATFKYKVKIVSKIVTIATIMYSAFIYLQSLTVWGRGGGVKIKSSSDGNQLFILCFLVNQPGFNVCLSERQIS